MRPRSIWYTHIEVRRRAAKLNDQMILRLHLRDILLKDWDERLKGGSWEDERASEGRALCWVRALGELQ